LSAFEGSSWRAYPKNIFVASSLGRESQSSDSKAAMPIRIDPDFV
jgi:hypothetical protein